MKQRLTIITRVVVCLMGIGIIAICAILLPELAREEAIGKAIPPLAYPFLIGAWVLSIPIFVALYQTLKILGYIDQNKAFSGLSVKSLNYIKYCSIVFSILIAVGAITVIILAQSADPREDLVPIATLGFIFTFASLIIAVFVAVLQRLLRDVIYIKSENDLTV